MIGFLVQLVTIGFLVYLMFLIQREFSQNRQDLARFYDEVLKLIKNKKIYGNNDLEKYTDLVRDIDLLVKLLTESMDDLRSIERSLRCRKNQDN